MKCKYNVAIVGVTGVVGETFLTILQERKFPIDQLFPLASERSAGEEIEFAGESYAIENVADFDFSKAHFAFFSAGGTVSALYAPKAATQGCVVIDNTSHFRYQPDLPLVIPEVNPHALENYRERNIIANPNCSTIQLLVALKPIYDAVGITRIDIATYQSVSGAGRRAIEELVKETASILNGQGGYASEVFSKQIAFNVLPQIDLFEDNGYTREEMKIIWETHKILGDNNIIINPTAVRVPVFFGHSEAVNIETRQAIDVRDLKNLLAEAPGIKVVDNGDYPTALTHAASQDEVFVGRIRQNVNNPNGFSLWVVADNIRKGAALNAIQIAEILLERNFYLN